MSDQMLESESSNPANSEDLRASSQALPSTGAEFEEWFVAHLDMQMQAAKPRTPRSKALVDHIWPAGQDYYSPLNPCFLLDFATPEMMNRRRIWMVRDGLIPLLWFFRNRPAPDEIHSRILVHDEFAAFVPPAWRAQAGTYSLVSLRDTAPVTGRPRRGLFLTGLGMDLYCSLPRLTKILEEARAQYDKREFQKLEIFSFLPTRFDGFGLETKLSYFTHYVQEITKAFGSRIQPLEWSTFESFSSWEDFDLLELNEKYLVADSMLSHMPLRRGARLHGRPLYEPKAGEQLIRLSPHHGVRVRPKITAKWALAGKGRAAKDSIENYLPPEDKDFEEAMRSEVNLRMPWPKWFGEWARKITWN